MPITTWVILSLIREIKWSNKRLQQSSFNKTWLWVCKAHVICTNWQQGRNSTKKFIENLFNEYSKKFETSLVDNLKYKVQS